MGLFRKGKTCIIAKFHRTDKVVCCHFRVGEPYSPGNAVFLRLQDRDFSFQNNPKDLDLSYKTDLDLWECLGRVKACIVAKFHRTVLVVCCHF